MIQKTTIAIILLILVGIIIPKFLIVKTFSDIYEQYQFDCMEEIEKSKNKLLVMTSSFGNGQDADHLRVIDYTYFGIKINDYDAKCKLQN